jgi:hypothetical protein
MAAHKSMVLVNTVTPQGETLAEMLTHTCVAPEYSLEQTLTEAGDSVT